MVIKTSDSQKSPYTQVRNADRVRIVRASDRGAWMGVGTPASASYSPGDTMPDPTDPTLPSWLSDILKRWGKKAWDWAKEHLRNNWSRHDFRPWFMLPKNNNNQLPPGDEEEPVSITWFDKDTTPEPALPSGNKGKLPNGDKDKLPAPSESNKKIPLEDIDAIKMKDSGNYPAFTDARQQIDTVLRDEYKLGIAGPALAGAYKKLDEATQHKISQHVASIINNVATQHKMTATELLPYLKNDTYLWSFLLIAGLVLVGGMLVLA